MIVYLHGFSSGAASRKATQLKHALEPIDVLVPEYPSHQPRNAIATLVKFITHREAKNKKQKFLLIGSSLGGFYAQYLATRLEQVSGVVLINPALQPQLTLKPYIGQLSNQVTGESFKFSERDFLELAEFDIPATTVSVPTLVLLDKGDDVIDYQFAAHRYQDIGRVIAYPGGSHWFDHLEVAIPEIQKFHDELC